MLDSPTFKFILLFLSELSARELGSLQLSIDHEFTLAASLAEHPEFVSIDSFPKSHVLLLPLLSLYYNRFDEFWLKFQSVCTNISEWLVSSC